MRVRRTTAGNASRSSATSSGRLRCSVCKRFARVLVLDGRCEPCAGVLPLDFSPTPAAASAAASFGLARECVELGEHDWTTGTEPCACGRPHEFRVCGRCLLPGSSECDTASDVVPGAGVELPGVA